MNFHSILALTNLSPQGNRAVLRAALLAAERRALLKIMYAPFGIFVKNVADTGGHLEAVAEEARWADTAAHETAFVLRPDEAGCDQRMAQHFVDGQCAPFLQRMALSSEPAEAAGVKRLDLQFAVGVSGTHVADEEVQRLVA